MSVSPNPITVARSMFRARRIRRPRPTGSGTVDHGTLAPILAHVREGGIAAVPAQRGAISGFRGHLENIDPDTLSADAALAFWLNLYNAGALDLAGEAFATGRATVLRIPGAFDQPWARIAGEHLSLNDIEHGKLRRFHDPRIHGALVCGSASCPTLRYEPFTTEHVRRQLDDQMKMFLAAGGVAIDREARSLRLSRVFLWYGADFTRPGRMPTVFPAGRRRVAGAVGRWMTKDDVAWIRSERPRISFAAYDWELACSIA